MIRSRVTQAGSGACSTAARYHPFNWCQASRWSGGYYPSSVSTSAPASSDRRLLSPFKIAAIACPNLQIRDWSFAGSRRAETLPSTSLHVASEIHAFSLESRAWVFRTALHKAAKIPSSLVGAFGGRRGSRFRPLRYLACSLKGALQIHPRTM